MGEDARKAVLDYAKAHGWRSGENPAVWRGHLALILPKRKDFDRGHYAAMPYHDVPAFIASLPLAVPGHALRFIIYTACRLSEALGASWIEIVFVDAVWNIPAERTKSGRPHRVPLVPEVVAILRGLAHSEPLVFGRLNADRLRALLPPGTTIHGFRSSFADWAGEETEFPRELVEAALAHTVGDEVERAYRRGDALERRRGLMEAWADFLLAGIITNGVDVCGESPMIS